jgi:O-methyltransferase
MPNRPDFRRRFNKKVKLGWPSVTLPLLVWFLFHNRNIHKAYNATWWRLLKLAYRLRRNGNQIQVGSSYRAHLAMAAKLLEIPPETEGVVVECGCFKGGSTANLSVVCDFVGRDLIVYDSFEGLPEVDPTDRYADSSARGHFRGELEQVKANIERYGVIERCSFRKGWFSDTLPRHVEPVALCFIDVDFQASIHDCLVNLWPHLIEKGYLFTDDYTHLDLCAVFYSEEFWQREFNQKPPGLIGAGSGIALGQFWVGPFISMGGNPAYPIQAPASTAYTRKDFSGYWGYRRDEQSN